MMSVGLCLMAQRIRFSPTEMGEFSVDYPQWLLGRRLAGAGLRGEVTEQALKMMVRGTVIHKRGNGHPMFEDLELLECPWPD